MKEEEKNKNSEMEGEVEVERNDDVFKGELEEEKKEEIYHANRSIKHGKVSKFKSLANVKRPCTKQKLDHGGNLNKQQEKKNDSLTFSLA